MKRPRINFEYKTFTFGSELTQEQKDYFAKYGVIQFKKFIEPETALTFISELNKIEKQWLEEGVEKINGTPLKFGKNEKGEPMIQRMCFTNQYSPVLNEFLHDPRFKTILQFLAPYEGRVGEDEKDGLVFGATDGTSSLLNTNDHPSTAPSSISTVGPVMAAFHVDDPGAAWK